jgi:hypothetical protein
MEVVRRFVVVVVAGAALLAGGAVAASAEVSQAAARPCPCTDPLCKKGC